MNDSSSIVVKCDTKLEDLPKRHLITIICIENMYYAFYINEKDIEKSKSILYIGKSIMFPDHCQQQFNLLQSIYKSSTLKSKNKINIVRKSSNMRNVMIKEHFKTEDDIFKTCCIFHEDCNPSMSVNLRLGVFYCFSCKSGGSVTKLLNKIRSK